MNGNATGMIAAAGPARAKSCHAVSAMGALVKPSDLCEDRTLCIAQLYTGECATHRRRNAVTCMQYIAQYILYCTSHSDTKVDDSLQT